MRPTRPLVALGLLTFLVLLAEGAVTDWSAVYLRDALGTSVGFAAMGYAAYSLTMALGRLTGGALVTRLGPVPLARASTILAATGLGAALLAGHPNAAIIGFSCVGLGLSNLVPILFSAAGRATGTNAGTAIAAVATTGYFGLLLGPALIGFTAEAFSLPSALGLLVLGIALVGAFAHLARRAADGREAFPADAEGEPFLERWPAP